jgi:hypothetical protein
VGLSIALKGPRHVTNHSVWSRYPGKLNGQTTC